MNQNNPGELTTLTLKWQKPIKYKETTNQIQRRMANQSVTADALHAAATGLSCTSSIFNL